ncbi:hypothetical protein [uncultured Alistipes sp.]|uniref:hypothetical protein n=1 Tax=uncultured Alistipes sp. TaxID=538949 RepID=UPI00260A48BA|nr:hypothetical protein [uncultured Alistipes sp.]
MQRVEQKGEAVPIGCDKLHVYDLTGRLLARCRLDCHATGFDLDPERGILVFVDPNGAVSLRSCPIPDVVSESDAD